MQKASSNRIIYDLTCADTDDEEIWEKAYQDTMDKKYKKNTRNFSKLIKGTFWKGEDRAPIYIIPRVRAGPSYKSVEVESPDKERNITSDDIYYAAISKGYGMQDLSSFTIGPVVGEGLCLVNSAFSKVVSIMHIEGGGVVDLRRKNFWKRSRKSVRVVERVESNKINIDGKIYDTDTWLKDNEELWLEEWDKWRKHIALCSMGDFHWSERGERIGYRYQDTYLSFVDWKKQCYIQPSYDLLDNNNTFNYLKNMWKKHNRILGLVHPMGFKTVAEKPLDYDIIREMFDSESIMSCQPYVVAGKLLGVPVYE